MALGARVRVVLGPRRGLGEEEEALLGWEDGDAVREVTSSVVGVLVCGVRVVDGVASSFSSSASSSTPNDSFPFATGFRFFFGGNGVEILCFDHQPCPFSVILNLNKF